MLEQQRPFNYGKTYNEVQDRQKKRKVQTVKEQALSFNRKFWSICGESSVDDDSVIELDYGCSSSSLTADDSTAVNDQSPS